ncbi:MAG: hypothetical protein P1U41_10770 [Vicingaceae bacterium]|nr:hypothetical protein [Vicingaceae bacterium]
MRNFLLLVAFSSLFTIDLNAQSDNQTHNSELKITEDGKRLEATIICLDAIESPTKYNTFAKQFISHPNFPQKTKLITSEKLRENINNYFINHPNLIDKVRLERKKAHDKLYGKRPY